MKIEEQAAAEVLWCRFKRLTAAEAPSPCPREQELSAYSRGRLDSRRLDRLELHLSRCGACLTVVMGERGIASELPLTRRNPARLTL